MPIGRTATQVRAASPKSIRRVIKQMLMQSEGAQPGETLRSLHSFSLQAGSWHGRVVNEDSPLLTLKMTTGRFRHCA